MKQKITVFQVREWSKLDDHTGDMIQKWFYAGFPKNGKPFEFQTNRDDIEVHEGIMQYNEELAEEIDLSVKFDSFKEKMVYYETGTMGK